MSRRLSLDAQLDSLCAFEQYHEEQAALTGSQKELLTRRLLDTVANELTDRQREIVLLYYFEHNTMQQIADRLGRNKSTVSRHLAAARRNIRRLMKYNF